jgi:hypothetical protein
MGDLTSIILDIQRAQLLKKEAMTRIAVWAERRARMSESVQLEGGLRLETGDRAGTSRVRPAPRLLVRFQKPGSPLQVAAGYGRTFQYVQAPARTDVLRTGLRVSEVLMQANAGTPALRSDLLTLGMEYWAGPDVLLGATSWLRLSDGVLVPEPTPGVIDGARPSVTARAQARGLEASVRKLAGPTRGFANYTLSWSRQRVGTRAYYASEDRRYVANLGVIRDLLPSWQLGVTLRAQSGAPYTRITMVDTDCDLALQCGQHPPVLYGTPSGQRARAFASLDLMSEWQFRLQGWTLAVYGQLRNVPGSHNAVTYHSSCICVSDEPPERAGLRDRFDRGLPRLPVLGLRARF